MSSKCLFLPRFHQNKKPQDLCACHLLWEWPDGLRYRFCEDKSAGKLRKSRRLGKWRTGPSSGEQRCPGVVGVASALVCCKSRARPFLISLLTFRVNSAQPRPQVFSGENPPGFFQTIKIIFSKVTSLPWLDNSLKQADFEWQWGNSKSSFSFRVQVTKMNERLSQLQEKKLFIYCQAGSDNISSWSWCT